MSFKAHDVSRERTGVPMIVASSVSPFISSAIGKGVQSDDGAGACVATHTNSYNL